MGGIFGDRPCESINRKLRPLSGPFVPPINTRPLNPVRQGLGKAFGRAHADWAGLGWAGLAAGHQKRDPRAHRSRQRNAAARRPQTAKDGPPKQGNAAARRPQTIQKKKEAPEPTPQDSEMQRHGGPKRPKTDQEPPKQGNAAARRPQTSQKHTKNGALRRPKIGRLAQLSARPTAGLGSSGLS